MTSKAIVLALVAVASTACGTTPDQRPVTLEVVALEVLAPTCGQVQCHSTSTVTEGYAFDTFDAARKSLATESDRQRILGVILDREMPPDQPMADEDVALLSAWIAKVGSQEL